MKDNRIERAEVFVVAPDVERYTWAEGMTSQYMVNVVLRLTAASGLQGIAGGAMITSHDFDRSAGEALRTVLPEVIGQDPARARGALAPDAQPRHADGPAGAFADRHRALGHDRAAGGHAALPVARRRARQRSFPTPRRRCLPITRPTSTTSESGRPRASRRSSSIAGACRSATCRCARRCTGTSRAPACR